MPKKHSVSAQKTTQNYWPRLRKRRSVLGVVYSTVCLVIYLLGYDVLSICWVMIFICLLGYDVLSVCWVMIFIYLLGYDVCRRFYSTADLLFARNLIRRCILFSYFFNIFSIYMHVTFSIMVYFVNTEGAHQGLQTG